MSNTGTVPAAERTLNLLELIAQSPDGRTASELGERLSLSRSSLFALLNTLKGRGYLRQDEARGKYSAGPAFFDLLPDQPSQFTLLIDSFQSDGDIANLTESVALVRLHGQQIVVMAKQDSAEKLRIVYRVGDRQLASESAGGRCLLAIPTATAATDEQRAIQQQGFALSQVDSAVEVALPICADGVAPLAALVIGGPASRFGKAAVQALMPRLRPIAARLSFRLGAAIYQPYGRSQTDTIGPMEILSAESISTFLAKPMGATLACIKPDGTPHVLPLWYEWDGKHIWLTASPNSVWKDYVRDNNRVSLTIDEPWSPLRRVFIEGDADWVDSSAIRGGVEELGRRITQRYLGKNTFQAAFANQSDWQIIRITPTRLNGCKGIG